MAKNQTKKRVKVSKVARQPTLKKEGNAYDKIFKEVVEKLETVLANQNLSIIDSYLAEARQEYDNLPDFVKTVLYCRDGILKADLVSPTHARTMKNKFDRLLTATKYNDLPEVDRLTNELLSDVNIYFDQATPTSSISTSLTR